MDLVKAGKDVILLRTFSKIYGMAGLRCGAAFGRPDLLEKIEHYGGWNFMPIPAPAAATAHPEDAGPVPQRKRINAPTRRPVFARRPRHASPHRPPQPNTLHLSPHPPPHPQPIPIS